MGLHGCIALVVHALSVHGAARAPPQVALLGAAKPRLLNAPPKDPEPIPAPVPPPPVRTEPPWRSDDAPSEQVVSSTTPVTPAPTPAPAKSPSPPPVLDGVSWHGLGGSPLSNAVRGVMALAVLYFMVHAIGDVTAGLGIMGDDLALVFEQLKDAVAPAPTLAVLFLALRVQWLHAGFEPPPAVTGSNDVAVAAVLLRAVVVCLPYADLLKPQFEIVFNDIGVFAILATTLVAVASTYYGQSPVLPSATYVVGLCSTYVLVSVVEYVGRRVTPNTLRTQVLGLARRVIGLAPMLGVLYLAAQMRSEHSTSAESPPHLGWAMLGCACALAGQSLVVLLAPIIMRGRLRDSRASNDRGLATLSVGRCEGYVVQGIQYICLATLVLSYVVLLVALVGVPTHPPGLSTTVLCVLVLSSCFLAVYVACALAMQSAPKELSALREAVEPVPMLAAVCLACRLRALSLRPDLGQAGGPPGWGMDGMFVLVAGVLVRLVEQLVPGCAVRCFALVLVYGGVATVLAAIATMNPASAIGKGSLVHAAMLG